MTTTKPRTKPRTAGARTMQAITDNIRRTQAAQGERSEPWFVVQAGQRDEAAFRMQIDAQAWGAHNYPGGGYTIRLVAQRAGKVPVPVCWTLLPPRATGGAFDGHLNWPTDKPGQLPCWTDHRDTPEAMKRGVCGHDLKAWDVCAVIKASDFDAWAGVAG